MTRHGTAESGGAGSDILTDEQQESTEEGDADRSDSQRRPGIDLSAQLSSTPFAIKLEFFAGPMDLLLHLINQREVPVSQVCMKDVCTQYLQVVTGAAYFDLEKASEFLVIAATLLAIKSRMLLPAGEGLTDEEAASMNPALEDEAFYEELRARLQEYERTKLRAEALIQRPQLGVDTFARVDRKALQPTPEMLAEPEELTSLTVLFAGLLKRIGAAGKRYLVRLEPISVVGFMMKVMGAFGGPVASVRSDVSRTFREILGSCGRGFNFRAAESSAASAADPSAPQPLVGYDPSGALATPRGVVIGSFIAVLELVKRGLVGVEPAEGEDFRLTPRFVAEGEEEERQRMTAELEQELDSDLEPTAAEPKGRNRRRAHGEREPARRAVAEEGHVTGDASVEPDEIETHEARRAGAGG